MGQASEADEACGDADDTEDVELDDEGEPSRTRSQVWHAVARFAGFGLLALALVAVVTFVVAEKASRDGILRMAERNARDIAENIIAPLADEALRARDPQALERLTTVMKARMTDRSLMRVKVWSAEEQVIWSDDPRLVGRTYPLEPQDAALLTTLGSTAEFTTLEREENAFEPQVGEVAEIYLGFEDRTGRPLLLELYVPVAGLEADARAQLRTILPVTLGGPAFLLLVLTPLALSMARRIDQAGSERATLLRHAVAASALERRRIAGDLHDGVVQDLAGIGYAIPAIVTRLPDGPESTDVRQKLERVTTVIKRDIAALRTVITDIYPPDLQEGGLVPASQLLLSEVRYAGIDADLDVDASLTGRALPVDAAVLGYRVLRESLRNVVRHSGATTAHVSLRLVAGELVVEVSDDGVGFDTDRPAPKGHFGLRLLEDTVRDIGGILSITSRPGAGTRLVVRFPVRWGATR
ncbi:sensor histidine kinase [Knoellia sp. CPCC 206435]|uniref:sensor histidine kinase n=1 Tax=Knoellia terrae TaxID=3404797 RepID=UPI003B438500